MYSPIHSVEGILFKRDDLYRLPNGVNGSKLRACEYLIDRAIKNGYRSITSGSACISPQHAIVSSVCRKRNIPLTTVIGGTTLGKAVKTHKSVQIAYHNGAKFDEIAVGYNPALQKRAKELAQKQMAYYLTYGIAIEDEASTQDLIAFHSKVAVQCRNIHCEHLILPFGSGNTGIGVLYGLSLLPSPPRKVSIMQIGVNRFAWASQRLERLGIVNGLDGLPFEVDIHVLHNNYATYGDKKKARIGSINFHPTYEGKVVSYLNEQMPEFWQKRDNTVGFWIVGGQI
jgi:1-aminocyclopropane-1-carboxylate deaminase/D-cysteine desulfhydrase-like pyridoxal-dependent ACC family enzyme